jgi:quinol monooxygenase YgiN
MLRKSAYAIVSAKFCFKRTTLGGREESKMTQHALYVQLEAKPGKEQEVATFLSNARSMVNDEPGTTAWFAIRMGPNTFGIFDAFANERGREAHLQGKVATQLMSKASQLFTKTPEIHRVDVLADKLPH